MLDKNRTASKNNAQKHRPRRLRRLPALRRLVRETSLAPQQLIAPVFVVEGKGIKKPIESMPGVFQWSVDQLISEAKRLHALDVGGIMVFGIPNKKDELASQAYAADGVVQRALKELADRVPDLLRIGDVCLCEYTSHGHCGLVHDGEVQNDETLELLAQTAVSQVRAGAQMVAPSDMMDGRVKALRKALDGEGFSHTPIMSYAVKYASSFYAPFRDAAQSTPQFGDRRSYQMDPANRREALREAVLDLREGADILLVKPAGYYLDIVRTLAEKTQVPIAAYQVSGEYAMIKAAAQNGWIDEQKVVLESLTGIRRAGAQMILTYFAAQAAQWLEE